MASGRLHPVRPRTLAVLEHEFAAHLLEVAALQRILACSYALEYRLHRVDEHVGVHVLGLGPEFVCSRHAEVVVQLARWVGVNGKWAACGFRVHGYQLRTAAANDCDKRGSRQCEKVIRRDG